MGAPRSTGGFNVHRSDIDALADYVDQITPIGPAVSDSPAGRGRYIKFPPQSPQPRPVSQPRPLQIIDAANADHPGRVRVVNGFLGNLLPEEMSIPDAVLPDGTDNHCYLTMSGGTNYVYGKVLVDRATGLYTAANVYVVTSQEVPDGTYAYLLIGTVNYGGTTLNISQAATGSQQLLVVFSSDGTTINPFWTSSTA